MVAGNAGRDGAERGRGQLEQHFQERGRTVLSAAATDDLRDGRLAR
jgi:hypothetical protein